MVSRLLAAGLFLLVAVAPAAAADWIASKLRGTAEVQVEATWQPLGRGDTVADDQMVRTGPESRLELTRGAEVIALGPETEVRIKTDLAKSFTIIHQGLGTVEVEAEIKTFEHLEVRNKFLSAVVKGTVFVVTADAEGASVDVSRGLVAVESLANHHTTSVPAGNRAFVRIGGELGVAGEAPPAVFDASGLKLPMALPVALPTSGNAAPPAAELDLRVADAGDGAGAAQAPGALLINLPTAAASGTAKPVQSNIDIAAAGIGIAIGIAIGALALLARRFFA